MIRQSGGQIFKDLSQDRISSDSSISTDWHIQGKRFGVEILHLGESLRQPQIGNPTFKGVPIHHTRKGG
jgi:hypothetical protein